jgi:hypothetical protein
MQPTAALCAIWSVLRNAELDAVEGGMAEEAQFSSELSGSPQVSQGFYKSLSPGVETRGVHTR